MSGHTPAGAPRIGCESVGTGALAGVHAQPFTAGENISRDSPDGIAPLLFAQERAMVRMVAVALLVANFANVVCLFRYF